MNTFVRSTRFWTSFGVAAVLFGIFFAWELGAFGTLIPVIPRPAPTNGELFFTITLIVLIALNTGLYQWQKVNGSCPFGTRSATGVAGVLGAFALLCPVCLAIPVTFLGASIAISAFAPYIPLLRVIAIVLLLVTAILLWPRAKR